MDSHFHFVCKTNKFFFIRVVIRVQSTRFGSPLNENLAQRIDVGLKVPDHLQNCRPPCLIHNNLFNRGA